MPHFGWDLFGFFALHPQQVGDSNTLTPRNPKEPLYHASDMGDTLRTTREPDRIVEKALDILFSLTDLLNERTERQGWLFLSEAALQRVWDNEEDAIYDNWRELYKVPAQ